jgi:hypothetical protein
VHSGHSSATQAESEVRAAALRRVGPGSILARFRQCPGSVSAHPWIAPTSVSGRCARVRLLWTCPHQVEDPTRRLPPVRPAVRERSAVYVAQEEAVWRQEVLDRLRSQTAAIAMLAVLAVAALGVGLWALYSQGQDDNDASGARVRQLEQRVDAVESRLQQRAGARQDVTALRQEQRALDERLRVLEQSAEDAGENLDAMSQAVSGTQQAVEQVEERVEQLEQLEP